ncbi:hypothetical protein ACLOJK_030458 [Asimina triloba]
MAQRAGFSGLLLSLLVLEPALCSAYHTFTPSRTAYYGSMDGLGTWAARMDGACGYGEFGRKVYGGNVAAVSKLFEDGVGCGACYRVRCTNPKLCTKDGVEIMVTNHGAGDNTDFILSIHAFSSMDCQNEGKQLMAYGVVAIEYRWCSPYLLLIIKMYKKWVAMRRAFGGVWDMPTPPKGPLKLQLLTIKAGKKKWVELMNVIPGMWKPGMAYDSGLHHL